MQAGHPMTLDPKLFARPISANDFIEVGAHAEALVRLAKDVKAGRADPTAGARRRYSQRDIVLATGKSQPVVSRLFSDYKDALEIGSAEPTKGRVKRYSVEQYLRALQLFQPVEHRPRAVTIVFANFKGGCAKSTTTATYAAGQALKGRKVLVVDMDPQGTLSALFGIQPSLEVMPDNTLLPYFEGERTTIDYAIMRTRLPTLDIIPSASALSGADFTIPVRAHRGEYGRVKFFELLDVALEPLRAQYDMILIDSPPSLSYLTSLSCYAADGMIVPLQPSLPDYASSATFFQQMGGFFGQLDQALTQPKEYAFARMLITRHDSSRPHRDMETEIRATYGGLVLNPVMIESNAVKEASNNHLTVYELDHQFVHRDTLNRALESADSVGRVLEDLTSTVVVAGESGAAAA